MLLAFRMNYVQHLIAMLCSLYENNKEHIIHTHLIHEGLSQDSLYKVTKISERYRNTANFYNVDSAQVKNLKLTDNSPFSIATYFRIFLPSLLSDSIDKVLYLDDDIIVLGDVSQLFDLPLDDYGVAAVQDVTPTNDYHRHLLGLPLSKHAFCCGVMLVNLKYWRENNVQSQLFKFASKNFGKLFYADQDAMNRVLCNRWFKLPCKYSKTPLSYTILNQQNFSDYYETAYAPIIMHYAAHVKPWLDVWFPERKYYWKYVKLSGFENPKVTYANRELKIKIYKSVIRYIINKNIRPFIPDLIEMIIFDLFHLVQFLIVPFCPKGFKKLRLRSWLRKYGYPNK